MPLDIYFVNSLAQSLALVVIMIVIFVLRKSGGSRAMLIGVELLLLTILMRRIDEVGMYFGVDVFGRPVLVMLSWIVILILLFGAIQTGRRRILLRHITDMIKKNEKYAEALQKNGDALSGAEK